MPIFYFGVTVDVIVVAAARWEEDFDSIWYLDEGSPRAFYIYKEDFIPDGCLFDRFENCIVQVNPDYSIVLFAEV